MKELKCLFVLEMGYRLLLGLPGSLAALPGSGRGHRAGVPTSGSAPPAAGAAGRRLRFTAAAPPPLPCPGESETGAADVSSAAASG